MEAAMGVRVLRVVNEAGDITELQWGERRHGGWRPVRVSREGFGDVGVGVVGEVVAAPVVGPGLGVVLDIVVGARGQGEVGAASTDGGLPGFAAAGVSVGGAGAAVGSGGGPVAPAGANGVLESSGGIGGGACACSWSSRMQRRS